MFQFWAAGVFGREKTRKTLAEAPKLIPFGSIYVSFLPAREVPNF